MTVLKGRGGFHKKHPNRNQSIKPTHSLYTLTTSKPSLKPKTHLKPDKDPPVKDPNSIPQNLGISRNNVKNPFSINLKPRRR